MLQIGATPARFTAPAVGIVDATIPWFPVRAGKRDGIQQALRPQGALPRLDQCRLYRAGVMVG